MQIQRVIDECDGEESNSGKELLIMMDSAKTVTSETQTRFLHVNDKQNNDRIAYATIDRLALKRTRLPLQLVPIDDNNSATEKKDKTNGEKRVNGNRKNSPKRPSFKMRSGIPLSSSGQSKSRGNRTISRTNQPPESFENVSKELVSRLLIYENIIRNNSNKSVDCEVTVKVETASNKEVLRDHSLRDSRVEAIKQEVEIDESLKTAKQNSSVTSEMQRVDLSSRNVSEKEEEISKSLNFIEIKNTQDDEFFESIEVLISENKDFLDSLSPSTSTSSLSSTKIKRHKAELSLAKNVMHCMPMYSQTRRQKKTNGLSKNDNKSNLQCCKSFSREELRHSISLPLHFVHVASATNPKLLQNLQNREKFDEKIIKHDEKCADIQLIDNDYQDKLMKNIYRNDKVRSSFLSLTGTKVVEETCHDEKDSKQAKVLALEKSQGVPEVVKTSENEGNVEYALNIEQQDTSAPVYEAIAEFSINDEDNSPNSSFLWGSRRPTITNFDKLNKIGNFDEDIEINGTERNSNTDCKNEENSYDAYDDVGLSRDDNEEDYYDDVGLPSKDPRNSSSDTIFEEINSEINGELYDDVVPGPIGSSTDLVFEIKEICDDNDLSSAINKCSNYCSAEKNIKDLSLREKEERNECRSPSIISNDYSSVEEGFDDFEEEEDDGLYDDVELPSQERVNSLYAGSSSGSQLGSLYNGKESEWEDLEEAAPALPLTKKNVVTNSRLGDSQPMSVKKKCVQRWSRKVRRQKSKVSRKNQSANRSAASRGTSTFSGSYYILRRCKNN